MISIKKNKITPGLLLVFWVFVWLSISTSPADIKNINLNNYVSIINFFRISMPLMLSIIGFPLLYFFIYKKKTGNISNYLIFYFFIIYFILQIVGLYYNDILNFDISYFFLPILAIGALEIFLFLKFLNLPKSQNIFLYISIFILAVANFFVLLTIIENYSNRNHMYLYNSINLDDKILEQIFPRVTGFSRSIAIINLFIISSFIFLKKNKYIAISECLTIIFFSIIIWGVQSRGSILCFGISFILLLLLSVNCNLKKKILVFFVVILIPISTFESYKLYKTKVGSAQAQLGDKKSNVQIEMYVENTRFNLKQGSSGRVQLWQKAINNYDKGKIFGYGPQADRLLISEKLAQQYGNNVSNGFLYAFLCSGYFGLIIFLIINLQIILSIYKIVFIRKIFSNEKLFTEKVSVIFLLFFGIRIFFENSYAVFSIDFLLTLVSLFLINNYLSKKTI